MLTPEESAIQHTRSIEAIVNRLAESYAGVVSRETVLRVVSESYAGLKRTARNKVSYPITEKFAFQRLRAISLTQNPELREQPEVLFVCVQNAGRSQMAMGLLKALSNGKISVMSAGSAPSESISANAVESMRELGIDISEAFPKPLTDDVVRAADIVITMGCGDACPLYPGKRYIDWQLDDPADMNLDGVRVIRDQIRAKVEALIAEIDAKF